MDWLNTIMPTAATLLGGPAAGIAVKFLADKLGAQKSTVDAVTTALQGAGETPEGRIKLAELDAQLKQHTLDIGLETERLALSALQAVNATMQAEAASDHWPTYTWRPFVGFIFGIMFLGTYFILPLMQIPVPTVPSEAWLAIGGVLGVASWFRGKMQSDPNVSTDNRG